jgi:hypothetical protein
MGRGDRAVALLLLVLAAYTITAARDMTYMQGRTPGPGFAPFWIGVGLALASGAILIRRRGRLARGPAEDGSGVGSGGAPGGEPARAHAQDRRNATTAIAAGLTLAAVVLIGPLGMSAALALLLLGFVRVLGGSWRQAGVTAVALPAGLYILFALWLKVPLPRGPWGF